MDKQQFIQQIAAAVIKYAPHYNIKCHSAIIAQAILESDSGNSYKARYNNFFGLKYRANRLTCNSGTFEDKSKEQNADGTYRDIVDIWYAFDSLESGVEGYFQFTNISKYANLKNVECPTAECGRY